MTNSVLSRKIYLICVFICSTTSTSCPSCPQRITWTTVRRRWMRSMQLSQTWRSPWREERRPTRWCWNTPPNYTEIWQPHTPIGLYHTSALKITSAVDFISAVAIAQDWHDLLTDYHHNNLINQEWWSMSFRRMFHHLKVYVQYFTSDHQRSDHLC